MSYADAATATATNTTNHTPCLLLFLVNALGEERGRVKTAMVGKQWCIVSCIAKCLNHGLMSRQQFM
jgi:hypothetical protein